MSTPQFRAFMGAAQANGVKWLVIAIGSSAKIFCPTCAEIREIEGVQRFRCPVCDTPSGDIRQGRELEIVSVELETNLFATGAEPAIADHSQ